MNWTPKQFEAFALLSDPKVKYAALLGGSRSGKSFTIAHKFRQTAHEFPESSQYILRKTMADARDTVWLQTMLPILQRDAQAGHCTIYKQPTLAEYKNGSIIKIGGLHPSEIDKVLGGEHGRIWVNEASEPAWQNIPTLMTRLNARTPHRETKKPIVSKLYADFNPTTVKHWTHKAFIRKVDPATEQPWTEPAKWGWLRMNPTDNLANLADGYLDILESLSPRDKDRFLFGEFGQLAGLVFDNFDPEKHVYDSTEIGKDWKLFRAIDFGFTNPFVCLWAYYDSANETLYIDDEHYQANVTTPAHAEIIKQKTAGRRVEATVADHDAGDRKILEDAGIPTEKADKDVASGINQLYDAFNRGKVLINRRCTNLIDEIYSYQWKESSTKDEPVKEKDHACFTGDTIIRANDILYVAATGVKPVYKFMGAKVTACHEYATQRGFVRLDALRESDNIVVWKKSLLMEYTLGDTRTLRAVSFASIMFLLRRNAQAIKQNACTGIYGKSTMGIFLKACTSITKTATALITHWIISNLLLRKSIIRPTMLSICRYGVKIWITRESMQVNGIKAKLAKNSIKKLHEIHGIKSNLSSGNVTHAKSCTAHGFRRDQNSALVIAKLPLCGEEKVYAVATKSGTFKVNSVIVSNCDALRYLYKRFRQKRIVYASPL